MSINSYIYGIHPIITILNNAPNRILRVFIKKQHCLINLLEQKNIQVEITDIKWLDKKTNRGLHQGILAEIKIERLYKENDLSSLLNVIKEQPLLLILDGIQDPRNFGACLRNAEAFGVHAVIIPKDRTVKLSPSVKKTSCGASEIVPIIMVTNLVRTINYLKNKNILIIGTVEQSSSTIFNSKLIGPIAFVMGSEEKGIRYLTRKYCDEIINIPMLGYISSLNVSVAAGICLFETIRQRMNNK